MTTRDKIYKISDNENLSTYEYDEQLPSLPLPDLDSTLDRYYESLKPFANEEELVASRKIIENFKNGIGKDLHDELKKRAETHRNWLEKWWEDYAYHMLRLPLLPYTVMAMPFVLESVFVSETPETALQVLARICYHSLEFYDLIKSEKLRPAVSDGGKIKYSSKLYKRFYQTVRLPGIEMDKILSYSGQKDCETGIVIARGRIFKFRVLNEDNTFLSAQQLLQIFEIVRAKVDSAGLGDCVPVLTSDDRTSWAKNRQYLEELSAQNKDLLKFIDSSILMVTLDEHEPKNYSETANITLAGDFHSKWCDKTSVIVSYRNGRVGCIGEHSAYDGTISVSYALFILLSFAEYPEPDWNERPTLLPKIDELCFNLDNHIQHEIQRVMEDCEGRRGDVLVQHDIFDGYGKSYLKKVRLHPDAFIQMTLQLAYYKMYNEVTATYETALMRHYFNGRTETLRSCTVKALEFVKAATNPKSSKKEIYNKLQNACKHHNWLMEEARKGNGVDRHLFGLWCVAFEKGIETPEFYSDPLYLRSGGGGNFVLSTSTLGYTITVGFVAPMVMDGYGVFYSLTNETIQILTSTYRASSKTSATKFNQIFFDTLIELRNLIDEVQDNSKL